MKKFKSVLHLFFFLLLVLTIVPFTFSYEAQAKQDIESAAPYGFTKIGKIFDEKVINKETYYEKYTSKEVVALPLKVEENVQLYIDCGEKYAVVDMSGNVVAEKKSGTTVSLKKGNYYIYFKDDYDCAFSMVSIEKKGLPVLSCGFYKDIYFDGISPVVYIYNNTGKKLKYLDLEVQFYNAVNDKVSCDITGDQTKYLRITGPIKKNELSIVPWGFEDVFYNSSVSYIKITKARVTYMNGKTKEISVNLNGKQKY